MAFHSSHLSQDLSSLHHFAADQQPPQHHHQIPESTSPPAGTSSAPNWLNTALLRNHYTTATDFLNLQSSAAAAAATDSPTSSSQWLPRHHNESACFLQRNHSDVIDDVAADSVLGSAGVDSSDLKKGGVVSGFGEDGVNSSHKNGGGGGGGGSLMGDVIVGEGALDWRNARYKSEILSHPLYGQLLSAHVACLRIATPVDQLPRIDAQLAQSQQVVAKYSALAQDMVVGDDKELDQFMTHYVLLLCSFKEQLQQHVRVHAMEAVMACWEIEQSLQSLTGVSPGQSTGATMSDDEDDPVESDMNMFEGNFDSADTMGFGPLVPTESERSLMERVRQELKHELKQGYKEKIVDIREEILRKRRAGKLPGDTTSVLKAWWQSHSKWPYPTEEDKARLVQETGLQLKQINNWFINQRKRNWHSNASSSSTPSSTKSKRKK